ncbi:MAG: hypothetical protein EBT92_19375 [Planctomycetes bacterium]|nr:hypothetical protein [Planctomycetota bacterium]
MEEGNQFENLFLELIANNILACLGLKDLKHLRAASKRLCVRLRPYIIGKEYVYRPLCLASREGYDSCRRGFGDNISISICYIVPSPTMLRSLVKTGAVIELKTRGTCCSPYELTRCLRACEGSLVGLNIILEPSNSCALDHRFKVALGRLARLESLNLSGHLISSTNFLKDLRLKKLDLEGCGLTDTTAMHDLPSSLTALNVSKNYLHPDSIIRLADLTQLTELNVSDCGVRDDIFGRLRNLKTLNAAGNDIDEVRITCDLERLDLSCNKRHLILRGELSAITTLIMGCSTGADGLNLLEPSMSALTSAEKLEVLEISRMPLEKLQSLEILIGGNRGLNRLALKSVFVCNQTNAGMERILASLERLTWLDFDSTNLGFSFVKALEAYGQPMVALTTLIISLQYMRIDADLVAFTRALQLLPALKVLNMQNALQHADSVMTVLKYAPESLTDLNLANNPFYPLDKGQVAARSALELCMSELHRFEHLTSVAISYPFSTKLSLVGNGSVLPTIVEIAF